MIAHNMPMHEHRFSCSQKFIVAMLYVDEIAFSCNKKNYIFGCKQSRQTI
jgi:hypothetical protein